MGMSGEDREELHGIFKALSGAVAAPHANPRLFMPNI
jgi:hypothetical protein